MTGSRYVHEHSFLRSLRRWCFYFLVLNAAFVTPMLLARASGYDPPDTDVIRSAYIGGAILAALGATVMIYRFSQTAYLSLDATHLTMPHYLWPRVRLQDITAVYLNPRTPDVLLLGVHRQLPRSIHASSLSPPIAADELAERVRAAVADVDARKARALAHASCLDARSQALAWASVGLAMALLAVHTLAWRSGSRFDDLDLLASGAYLQSLAMHGDALRVLDALVLHASVPHLLSNVATLLLLGTTLEHALGPRVLLATFVTSGAIAIIGSGGLAPQHIHVGASGGLFGLFGLLALLRIVRPALLSSAMHAVPLWLLSAVLTLSLGVSMPGVDWVAHMIGLLVGVAIGVRVARTNPGDDTSESYVVPSIAHARRARWISASIAAGILVGVLDTSRRTLSSGDGLQRDTLQALVSSKPNLDALNAIAWRSLVEKGEHRSMARPLIHAFSTQQSLSASQRDTLAALYFLSDSADRAAGEQVTALLHSKHLPHVTQAEMAARLAVYVTRATSESTRQRSEATTADEACVRVAVVTFAGAQPQRLRIHTRRSSGSTPFQGHQRDQARWISTPTADCSDAAGDWTLDRAAWQHAEELMRVR